MAIFGPLGDGAAFDPATGRWGMLPPAPLSPRRPVTTVWTGKEMIVWGDGSRAAAARDGAAYDPVADRWRSLPPAPLALNEASAAWTGKKMLVFGALLDGNNHSTIRYARGIAYDPEADRWRELPDSPLSPQASSVAWTGNEVLAWDYELAAGAYDPVRNAWRKLPDLPLRFGECYPESATSAEVVLAWYCGLGALLEIATSEWHRMSRPPAEVYGRPVAAGRVVLFAGAAHEGVANALWAYMPDIDHGRRGAGGSSTAARRSRYRRAGTGASSSSTRRGRAGCSRSQASNFRPTKASPHRRSSRRARSTRSRP